MQLREIMSREVNGIRPDAPLAEAITKLKNLEGEPLAVYEGERLFGMITEHDIIGWTSQGGEIPARRRCVTLWSATFYIVTKIRTSQTPRS